MTECEQSPGHHMPQGWGILPNQLLAILHVDTPRSCWGLEQGWWLHLHRGPHPNQPAQISKHYFLAWEQRLGETR